jgi:hypothetical protein
MKMKAPSKSQANRSTTRFIMRPYRRIPTWYMSYYMSGEYVGKGVVTNLSCAGMRVLGDHTMKPGTELTVRIMLEEDRPPIEIQRVSVQWVNESEFGLKIVFMSPSAANQIAQLLVTQAGTRRGES